MDIGDLGPGTLSRVRRGPGRARYERATVYAILDAAPICHVCVLVDGVARALPMAFGREGDSLYLHGATGNASLQAAGETGRISVTCTVLDGIVLARSAFHHSMNYRSAVVFGTARLVEQHNEKLRALALIINHMVPGRWDEARLPTASELRATRVTHLDIEEASAKVRNEGPVEEPEDLVLSDIWAGHVPLVTLPGAPVPDTTGPLPDALAPSVSEWLRHFEAPDNGNGSGSATLPVRADS